MPRLRLTRARALRSDERNGSRVCVRLREVERGLNDIRLAVLGILVGIALTVGFGVPGSVWVQVLAGLGAFATGCVLIRWRWSLRHHSSAPHVGS